jgi:hypothetical protein
MIFHDTNGEKWTVGQDRAAPSYDGIGAPSFKMRGFEAFG